MTVDHPQPPVAGNQGRPSRSLPFPWVPMTTTLLATIGLIGWLIAGFAACGRSNQDLLGLTVRLTELRGTITYLDEVLTMSARMAAATGDMSWQQRYDRFVPELDTAIAEAKSLAGPETGKLVDEMTRAANDELIDLETEAFVAAGNGARAEASAVLNSDEYARQKAIYAGGMRQLSDALQSGLQANRAQAVDQNGRQMMYAAILSVVLVAFWASLAGTIFRWRQRTVESEARANRLAEAVLEAVVIHDEARILDANHAFLDMVGLPLTEVLGRSIDQFVDSVETPDAGAAGGSGAADFVEMTVRRSDGTLVCTEMRSSPFSLDCRLVRLTTLRDITARKRAEAEIRQLAYFDSLTGLPNRVLFWERLEHDMALARRQRSSVSVLCIDLDRFKEVNDTLGHAAGDRLLTQVATRLDDCLRTSDTLARLGGDEFAVVMNMPCTADGAAICAQRIIETLADPFDLDGHEVVIGASVGIALSGAPTSDDAESLMRSADLALSGAPTSDDAESLMRSADLALYRAKAEGRATFRFFADEMNVRLQARKTMERDLRRAIALDQFELVFQPQFDLKSGQILGVEALIRWNHPERGLIFPDEFIPLAEEMGLIVPIGEWVLRTACARALPWGNLHVAVNLSAAQFRAGLEGIVACALADTGLDPTRLELEITEGILLQDTEANLATLQKIKQMGVRIAMDDFGTGYSSLSYLRRFPFDKIKIDGSFIRDLNHTGEANAIVRAVLNLGRNLGMKTNAEGVETETQASVLMAEGCDEVQGFHFGRPMPADALEALLAQGSIEAERYAPPSAAWPVGQHLVDLACARVHELPLSEPDKERFGIEKEWCTPEVSGALRAKLGMDGARRPSA